MTKPPKLTARGKTKPEAKPQPQSKEEVTPMAGVNITIVGTMTSGEETQQVTITGIAAIAGLGVGGGPMPGGPPPIIWGGPIDPYPDIGFPAPQPPPGGRTPLVEWKAAWSPSTGWIVVGIPTGEHVTPSEEEK